MKFSSLSTGDILVSGVFSDAPKDWDKNVEELLTKSKSEHGNTYIVSWEPSITKLPSFYKLLNEGHPYIKPDERTFADFVDIGTISKLNNRFIAGEFGRLCCVLDPTDILNLIIDEVSEGEYVKADAREEDDWIVLRSRSGGKAYGIYGGACSSYGDGFPINSEFCVLADKFPDRIVFRRTGLILERNYLVSNSRSRVAYRIKTNTLSSYEKKQLIEKAEKGAAEFQELLLMPIEPSLMETNSSLILIDSRYLDMLEESPAWMQIYTIFDEGSGCSCELRI